MHRERARVFILGFGLAVTLFGLALGPTSSLFGARNATGYNQWGNPSFQTTVDVWLSESPQDHLFLSFTTPAEYRKSRPWTSISPVFMGAVFAFSAPFRVLGAPQKVFDFITFLPGLVLLVYLTAIGLRPAKLDDAGHTLTLGLTALWTAILFTSPSLWVGVLKFDLTAISQMVPLVAFCHLAVLDYERQSTAKSGFYALLGVALLTPIFLPVGIVGALVLWATLDSNDHKTNALWRKRLTIAASVGVCCFLWPRILASVGGLDSVGSSALYRTGLDGSTQYFQSLWQAISNPVLPEERQWSFFALPAFALVLLAGLWISERNQAQSLARMLGISSLPYFYIAIVFPQSTSIHPYCYDLLLLLPICFCVAYWTCQSQVQKLLLKNRGTLLAILMASGALLMTNLVELSRFKG